MEQLVIDFMSNAEKYEVVIWSNGNPVSTFEITPESFHQTEVGLLVCGSGDVQQLLIPNLNPTFDEDLLTVSDRNFAICIREMEA